MAIDQEGVFLATKDGKTLVYNITGTPPFLVAKGYNMTDHALAAPAGAPDVDTSAKVPVTELLNDDLDVDSDFAPYALYSRIGGVEVVNFINALFSIMYDAGYTLNFHTTDPPETHLVMDAPTPP